MTIPTRLASLFAFAALAGTTSAQSFNIDLGVGGGAGGTVSPTSVYGGAAAQSGVWNAVDVTVTTTLLDLGGALTGVTLSKTGGSNNYYSDNTNTTGDDDSLLDDMQDLGNTGSKVTYTISGLADGNYDIYFYCWTSYDEADQTLARVVGGGLNQTCGGTWTGAHAVGVTYVVENYTYASGGGDLELRLKGAGGGQWGSFNGIQIVDTSAAGGPVNYCTPGTSSNGCQAVMSAVGTASATATSGFTVLASSVEGAKDGLFFYGQSGQQSNSWGTGTSFQCVVTPVKRGGLLTGSGTAGLCDGTFSQDLNARWCPACSHSNHNPTSGQKMQLQLWYRDPFNTSNQTTSLSDALEVDVGP
jgi:hypothetical protein